EAAMPAVPYSADELHVSAAPKYDPDTGELIREMDIKPEAGPAPQTVPVAKLAPRIQTITSDGIDIPGPFDFIAVPLRLLDGPNLLVMFFILLAHTMTQFILVALSFGFFLLAPFLLVWQALMVSHFANVIDEMGPQSNHELPTPLRHLGWHEDTWGPFSQV